MFDRNVSCHFLDDEVNMGGTANPGAATKHESHMYDPVVYENRISQCCK